LVYTKTSEHQLVILHKTNAKQKKQQDLLHLCFLFNCVMSPSCPQSSTRRFSEFGYRPNVKVENLKNPFIFWQPAVKIWQIKVIFFSKSGKWVLKNPLNVSKSQFFEYRKWKKSSPIKKKKQWAHPNQLQHAQLQLMHCCEGYSPQWISGQELCGYIGVHHAHEDLAKGSSQLSHSIHEFCVIFCWVFFCFFEFWHVAILASINYMI